MTSTSPTSSALILTGGGNRGAIQAGAVLALFENGYRPDLILGVSAGAINGSFLAFHPTIGGVDRMLAIWRRLDGKKLFGPGPEILRSLAVLLFGRRAEYSNRGLRTLLENQLPSRRFSDTAVPFVVTATSHAAEVIEAGHAEASSKLDSLTLPWRQEVVT